MNLHVNSFMPLLAPPRNKLPVPAGSLPTLLAFYSCCMLTLAGPFWWFLVQFKSLTRQVDDKL